MDSGSLLEFERLGSLGALRLERAEKGPALRIQEFDDMLDFPLVLGIRAPREAGRQAHPQLRIDAPRMGGMRFQVLHASADLEQVQKFGGKTLGGNL
jgi:hypothetical protein